MKFKIFCVSLLVVVFSISSISLVGCSNKLIDELNDLQDKCEKRSEELVQKKYNALGILSSYKNHYNTKLNKCFALVTVSVSGSSDYGQFLFNVNENKKIGGYTHPEGLNEHCFMSGNEGQKCKSLEDWNTLIKPYME